MPVHVEKRGGVRPYKIIETATGRVVGSSETRAKAEASAAHRNKAHERKKRASS
jgi:hypothetical protein